MLHTQHPVYINYTVEDGLPSNEVYHVLQDSIGYMWFATDNGACRFDGYSFQSFTTEDGLPTNTIVDLYLDNKGKMWFISRNGLLAYYNNKQIIPYQYNDTIEKYFHPGSLPIKNNFFIDSRSHIFMSIQANGLMELTTTGECKIYKNDIHVMELKKVEKKCLFLYSYNRTNLKKITVPFNDSAQIYLPDSMGLNYANPFIEIADSTLILSTYKYIILAVKSSIKNIICFDNRIIYYKRDEENKIWLGFMYGGVHCYNSILFEKPKKYLEGYSISSIYKDFEGGLWFTSLNSGVIYIPNIYISTVQAANSIAITCGDTNNWFASEKGWIYSFNQNKLTKYPTENLEIKDIYLDKYNNVLYVGTIDDVGIFQDGCFLSFNTKEPNKLSNKYDHNTIDSTQALRGAKQIIKLHDGSIAFVVYSAYYKMKNDKIYYINNNNGLLRGLYLFEDKHNQLWLGTTKGLYKQNGEELQYLGNTHPLLKKSINTIYDYNNGLLIGTKEAGLIYFNKDTLIQISKKDGLSHNSVTCLAIDDDMNIWAGTKKGLNRISNILTNKTPDVFQLHRYHGLNSERITDIAVWDGMLYVATDLGLNIIDPKKVFPYPVSRKPVIKKICIAAKDTLVQKNYILSYKQDEISFDFLSFNYHNPGQTNYKYRLIKNNNIPEWKYTENTNISFSYLLPGKYSFEVAACNKDGVWSIPNKLFFQINKPYWQTWWFYSLIFLGVIIISGIIFFTIFKIKANETKKRNQLENQLNKYRQQALSRQMNPHFIFNTLNSIQYFIYKNDKKASNKYLAMFSKLMRKTLENSQESMIPLQDELDLLSIYMSLEELRYKNKFSFRMKIDESIDTFDCKIPTLILQPYLENSIWHGIANKDGKGLITLDITKTDNTLLCKIEDNGIGREKAMQIKQSKQKTYQSFGTRITENRLKLINQLYGSSLYANTIDLYDKKGTASGTRVELKIPLEN